MILKVIKEYNTNMNATHCSDCVGVVSTNTLKKGKTFTDLNFALRKSQYICIEERTD